MLDMRGLKSSTGHTLCVGRTAGTGEACGRIWLGEVPRHVLSERGAAGAPVRRVFFDAHGQVASQDRLVVGCGEGQCWQERRGRNGVERGMGGANANNAAACRIEKPSHCRPLVDCFLLCLASLVLGQACEIMYLHVARVRQRSTM